MGEGVGGPCESGGFLVWPNRFKYMRDVKEEEHPWCTFFRPSCVQTTSLTNESDVRVPQ